MIRRLIIELVGGEVDLMEQLLRRTQKVDVGAEVRRFADELAAEIEKIVAKEGS